MSLAVRIDPEDPTPPYEQLRRQIADLVGTGVLRAGARLPSVRQLAADLFVAPGTVARTYRELEASGVVRSRRGAGTVITASVASRPEEARRALVDQVLAAAVVRLRAAGARPEEIRTALDRALDRRPAEPT